MNTLLESLFSLGLYAVAVKVSGSFLYREDRAAELTERDEYSGVKDAFY
jgi:hypothetical protein